MTSTVTVVSGGTPMAIFLATPQGAGPHPAIVVAHHRDGVDDFTRHACERLAEAGFIAAAPNLYHRRPAGEDTLQSRDYLEDGHTIVDVNATVDHLLSLKSVRRDAIGVLGHCMGGRTSFLCATAIPIFRVAGIFYGGGILTSRRDNRPPPIEFTRDISCPLIGFFGKEDKNPSPADVARISEECKRFNVRHEFKLYDGAGHAFQNFMNKATYREQQSDDAWSRLVPLLNAELKS
ncbi:MAG TPA: dienelactone hydrolase family protein [Stellaceae bacterium]|nr:dienelactone hydrolase family protein [Stellaceae bacterium]